MSEVTEIKQDELKVLKARAKQMGIKFHAAIGVEALKTKIDEALNGKAEEEQEEVTQEREETKGEFMARKRREASELVRIRVTCMNPNKKEWEGEIFTASNNVAGTFRKYVPFNADEGWHVPRIIYNMLVNRKCQVFHTIKDGRGNKVRKGKLIKEFSIEVLPNLTEKELKELAQRQAMSGSVDQEAA